MNRCEQWRVTEIGAGVAHRTHAGFRLTLPPAPASAYHDAQISDYSAPLRDYVNAPPLRLELRARAVGDLVGTAGFGFWNHAFVPGESGFRLPQALWFFFGGPANNIALAKGVPGRGWKAATFNARSWRFRALLPVAPLGFLLMRSKPLYEALWPLGQAAIGVYEAALCPALLYNFHTYSLDWRDDGATFAVDGDVALRVREVPHGPLGFIAWIDNQYAVVTPQGKFGRGLLAIEQEQSLRVSDIAITRQ